MGMCNTDCEGLCRTLGKCKDRNSLLISAVERGESVLEVIAERRDLLLRANDYKVSNEDLKSKLSENSILTALMTSGKQLEKKLSSLVNEMRLIEKDSEEIIRK